MRISIWTGIAVLGLGIVSCSRKSGEEQAKLRSDFDFVCTSQREYVQALALKGVNQEELSLERTKKILEGVQSDKVRQAVAEAIMAPEKERQPLLENAAKSAGIADWGCPELAKF